MVRVVTFFIFCLLIASLGSCSWGKGEKIAIQDLVIKPERVNFKVSPGGRYIAYIGIDDHCRNIFLLDTEDASLSKQLTYQNDINVQYFFWATPDSIVYSLNQSPLDSLRLFVVDIHTEQAFNLLPNSKQRLSWVPPLTAINGKLLAQMNTRDSTVFDLYRVPLDGSGVELVARNDLGLSRWMVSHDGKVRVAIATDSVQDQVWFRENEDMPFESVLHTDSESSILPLGPVKDSASTYYVLNNIGKDKLGLVSMNFDTGEQEVLVENPNADLNWEGYHFASGEMIYTSSTENKKHIEVRNEKLKRIFEIIKEKYSNYLIDIIDYDDDFNLIVFKIYTDVYPGQFLYYSSNTGQFSELMTMMPLLSDVKFSPMQEVSFNSRDGKVINGFLTYPLEKKSKYPVVVLVHDGPNRRDTWGFNQEVQFLANRGYAVFQVNYRGSIGFGKEFVAAGYKQWGGEIQNDINDGVAWLIHQGIADKERIAIMGTGFGGYSALYAACFNPSLYKCAISSSGYTNLFTYLKEIPPYYKQYLQLYYKIIGDPTQEYELFKAISPLFHAERVKMPILMFQGGRDRYNSITDVNQFVQKIRNTGSSVQYVYFEDEGKKLRNEENIVFYYQQLEAFLKKNL